MFKKLVPWFFVVVVLFGLDRLLKYYFIKNPSEVIGKGFLSGVDFSLAKNSGIAFGISFNKTILIIITIILILVLIKLLVQFFLERKFLEVVGLGMIIVGAFSNLIDRLRYGFVIDYINVVWFTVFNLADSLITIGVVLLLWSTFYKPLDKK